MAESRILQILIQAKNQTLKTFNSLNKSLEEAKKNSQKFALGLGSIVGSVSMVGLKTAAQLETAEIGLGTLLGSTEEAFSTIERIKEEAKRTPFELPGLTNAVQLLSSVTKDGNKSVDILLDIGEGLAAMGKGQSELDRIIVNLQQVGAIGYASMIDIKQFAYAGIPIFEMLQKETGLTGDALADFISNQGVSFDLLIKMFDKANDEGGRFFGAYENQTGSLTQSWSNMKDAIAIASAEFVEQTGIMDLAKNAMKKVTDELTKLTDNIEPIIEYIKQNTWVIEVLAGAILGALTPAIYGLITAFVGMAISLAPFIIGGTIIGGLVAGIIWVAKNWDTIKERIIEIWNMIKDKLLKIWNGIIENAKMIWNGLIGFFKSIWEGIQNIFSFEIAFITGLMLTFLDWIMPNWRENFENLLLFLTEIWESIKSVFSFAINSIKEVWEFIWNEILNFINPIWKKIKSIIVLSAYWIRDKFIALKEPFSKAWASIWEGVKNITISSWEGIKNVVKESINWIIDKINWFIKKANEIARKGAGALGIEVPQLALIPRLANGGIVKKPTLAMIGEEGPEAVIPLNKSKGVNSGSVINITINGDVSGEELVEKVKNGIMNSLTLNTRNAF